MSDAWAVVAGDLKRALTQAGRSECEIDRYLAALRPIVVATELAGRTVDLELAWALLGVEADRQRRRARHDRIRAQA
jgi:hypothetical protein